MLTGIVCRALDKNEYNHITATYFLLAERKLRAHRQEQATNQQKLRGSALPSPVTSAKPFVKVDGSSVQVRFNQISLRRFVL